MYGYGYVYIYNQLLVVERGHLGGWVQESKYIYI